MRDETRKAIALLRHQIISPVLMGSLQVQREYFAKIAQTPFEVPGQGQREFSLWTMKGWLKRYRKHGFEGLMPKVRRDFGKQRKFSLESGKAILDLRLEMMEMNIAQFYKRAQKLNLLGSPAPCRETLRRFLQENKMMDKGESKTGRKRYEMGYFGELWVGDFMHGPQLKGGVRGGRDVLKKAILLSIIDDHSRLIVGSRWSFVETTECIERVFKESVLTYGKPDRLYVDNGPSFSSKYLRLVCAHIGVGLVHSKPYDSPSRGKIERFFRTVRESFLIDAKAQTLEEMNESFGIWLREYHQRRHNGIDCRPVDRYQRSIFDHPRVRVNEDVLEELFMVQETRRVNKDATISFNKLIYEVPAKCIGQRIQIRYRQDRPLEIFLYEKGERVQALKVVDARANAKSYKPRERESVIAYHKACEVKI